MGRTAGDDVIEGTWVGVQDRVDEADSLLPTGKTCVVDEGENGANDGR